MCTDEIVSFADLLSRYSPCVGLLIPAITNNVFKHLLQDYLNYGYIHVHENMHVPAGLRAANYMRGWLVNSNWKMIGQ